MSIQIQIRGGTTAEHSEFRGVSREITCDTDKNTIVVQDGETLGGFPLAREDLKNVGVETLKARGGAISADFVGIVFSAPVDTLDGFLLCDGAAVSREDYAGLFGRIGTKFGAGDGATTFNLPDYRGCFMRGKGGSSAADFAALQENAAPNITGFVFPNGSTSDTSRSLQYVGLGGEGITEGTMSGAFAYQDPYTRRILRASTTAFANISNVNFDASRCSASYGRGGASEVRPQNRAVNFFIKY